MSMPPPEQLTDQELLALLVDLGGEAVQKSRERQADAGQIRDDHRWKLTIMPLSFESQLHVLFLGALDAFDAVSGLLATRASQQAFGMIRFEAETLALIRWMVEVDDPRERQWRAYRHLCGQLARWSAILAKDAVKGPVEAQEAADRAEAAKDQLVELAQADYGRPPKGSLGRSQLFAKYLKEGGYEIFAMQSELGSHPGTAGNTLFAAHDVESGTITFNLGAAFAQRAFWTGMALMYLLQTIREVGAALGWMTWLNETYGPLLKRSGPYVIEASRRKREARGQSS